MGDRSRVEEPQSDFNISGEFLGYEQVDEGLPALEFIQRTEEVRDSQVEALGKSLNKFTVGGHRAGSNRGIGVGFSRGRTRECKSSEPEG